MQIQKKLGLFALKRINCSRDLKGLLEKVDSRQNIRHVQTRAGVAYKYRHC